MTCTIINADIHKLMTTFINDGFEIRIVGGAVRDVLRGMDPKDIDLCTNATPDEMVALAERHNIRTIPTGLQHGTLTFIVNNEPYEVTTLRIDVETDGRHAVVEFTRNFKLDAERRDLTFNAMSMDINGKIYDYFGGQQDLEHKNTKFVGSIEKRIEEDYLRVFRYFRFHAQFDYAMSPARYIQVFAEESTHKGIEGISGERIWVELKKTIMAKGGHNALEEMKACKLFNTLIGTPHHVGIDRPDSGITIRPMMFRVLENIKQYSHPRHSKQLAEICMLFIVTELFGVHNAQAVMDRFKVSSYERKVMLAYVEECKFSRGVFDQHWVEARFHYEVACGADPLVQTVIASLERYGSIPGNGSNFNPFDEDGEISMMGRQPFTITGKDLIERGAKPGPKIGQLISFLRRQWYSNNCRTTRADMLAELDKFEDLNKVVLMEFEPDFLEPFWRRDTMVLFDRVKTEYTISAVYVSASIGTLHTITVVFKDADEAIMCKLKEPSFASAKSV